MRVILFHSAVFTLVFLGGTYADEVSGSFGFLSYEAAYNFFPNFYRQGGYRARVEGEFGEPWRVTVRLSGAEYPADNYIREGNVDLSVGRSFAWRGLEWYAGLGGRGSYVRFQYPAPYYKPRFDSSEYVGLVGGGYDVGASWPLRRFSVGASHRAIWAYPTVSYFDSPLATYVVEGEARYAVFERWSVLVLGGLEHGGYYPEYYLGYGANRPYLEAGVVFSF
ncbi:MAG: hypothetical protein JSU81_03770 [Candidatus Coatesbacteria bacterium]|nr:MAG: hypothetical protein JSU81_03770 [Candidatus Coatesbacteria bacterium]